MRPFLVLILLAASTAWPALITVDNATDLKGRTGSNYVENLTVRNNPVFRCRPPASILWYRPDRVWPLPCI